MNKKTIILLLLIIAAFSGCVKNTPHKKAEEAPVITEQKENAVTGTGILEPEEQYTIAASAIGEVLSAEFEDGQIISQGQVLYTLNQKDILNSITTAAIGLEQAELSYRQTADNLAKQTVKSTAAGTVKKVYVINGSSLAQPGMPICDVVNDRQMILKVPFLTTDMGSIYVGQSANISLIGTFYNVTGTVSKISAGHMVSANGSEVRMVEITIQNPGAVKKDDKATASIGNISCADVGTFDYFSNETVSAEGSGIINQLPVTAGDKVSVGTVLARLSTSDLNKALESGALNIKSAKASLENLQSKLADYTITSPVSGTVIKKNVKKGDIVSQANAGNLAVIADLTKIRFKMDVDEIDVTKINAGQNVSFTTEAMPDREFLGTVTYIADVGRQAGDATLYEVRVSVAASDELKSGMNIFGKILID